MLQKNSTIGGWTSNQNALSIASGIAVLLLLSSCDASPDERLFVTGSTMGTTFSVTVAGHPPGLQVDALSGQIDSVLDEIISSMSTYVGDSELSKFNASHSVDWYAVTPELVKVVTEANETSEISGGAFDVTVGPLVNLWGFGPEPATGRVPGDRDIQDAKEKTGFRSLEMRDDPPALRKKNANIYVDLSAIAKGYAVDRVASLLEQLGAENFLVEIGGDLRARGLNPDGEFWRVAVERPESGRRLVQRIVGLENGAMATSGNYRTFFEADGRRYSHTIDPRTGFPVSHELAAVSVIAQNAMQADALATALLVLGPDSGFDLAEQRHIAALFLVEAGSIITEKPTVAFVELSQNVTSKSRAPGGSANP